MQCNKCPSLKALSYKEVDFVVARLEENLRAANQRNQQLYSLSLSVGAVWIASDSTLNLAELISTADKAMYDQT